MTARIRIFVVDDEEDLTDLLHYQLGKAGFEVKFSNNPFEALGKARDFMPDLIILDVMMPEKDGFTLGKEIRAVNDSIPIIFLTAKSMKEDTLAGFKSGGDDYITKPFSMEELLLRLKAILRRTKGEKKQEQQSVFNVGNFTFDFKNQTLKIGNEEQHLTSKENALMKMLILHENQLLDRSQALLAIWGDDSYFNSRSMDVYIAKLRKYLKADESVKIINEHGRGFKFITP